jgi:hypothetical protein
MAVAFCLASAASARWLAGVICRSAFAVIRRPCPPGACRTERMRSSTRTGTPVRGSTQNVLLAWNVRFATTLREGPRSPSSAVWASVGASSGEVMAFRRGRRRGCPPPRLARDRWTG